jgi:hypothetical protein
MKYSYMYVYTRMIFAAALSPAIKIFHRHLGPNFSKSTESPYAFCAKNINIENSKIIKFISIIIKLNFI